jgi:hypothetical protein
MIEELAAEEKSKKGNPIISIIGRKDRSGCFTKKHVDRAFRI